MTSNDQATHQSLADWIGDIVALESHVEEALDRQLTLESGDTNVAIAFKRYHDTVRDSKRRALAYQKGYGSTSGNPIIKAGSNLLGKAAGMIDKMRNDSASKAMRDDYTAFNHLAISYTMLHATALAMHDDATSTFALEGLTTYSGLVQDVNHLIGNAVIAELRANDDQPDVDDSVVAKVRENIDATWKTTS